MGHNIMYSTYPENVNRKSVQAEWDDYVAHEDWQEGASGLVNPIEWHNITFNNEEDAREWIDNHDKGWYRQIAVKFKQYKNSKKKKELQDKVSKLYQDLNKLNKVYYRDAKSSFIGCKHCGSKIAREYIGSNNCPVCRHDLRPQSYLDRISKKKEAIKEAENKLRNYKSSQFTVRWLVKIEYHT